MGESQSTAPLMIISMNLEMIQMIQSFKRDGCSLKTNAYSRLLIGLLHHSLQEQSTMI
jgi:hypothetical protein